MNAHDVACLAEPHSLRWRSVESDGVDGLVSDYPSLFARI
jgi:hypothetical protein